MLKRSLKTPMILSVIIAGWFLAGCNISQEKNDNTTDQNVVAENDTNTEQNDLEQLPDCDPEDFIIPNEAGEDWFDAMRSYIDGADYDTVQEATLKVCDYETDDLQKFVFSSKERLRFANNGICIGIKNAWIGLGLYENVMMWFDDHGDIEKITFSLYSDDDIDADDKLDQLVEDISDEFPEMGDLEQKNRYKFIADLTNGFELLADTENSELCGVDGYDITIRKIE